MAQVKVRNLDDKEYVEEFRDETVRIPAGGYVEMGRSEANSFLGQITPLHLDGSGRCTKPKKLAIEEDPEEHAAARDQPLRFTAMDGNQFRTQQGLANYEAKLREEVQEVANAKPVRRRRAPSTPTTGATAT